MRLDTFTYVYVCARSASGLQERRSGASTTVRPPASSFPFPLSSAFFSLLVHGTSPASAITVLLRLARFAFSSSSSSSSSSSLSSSLSSSSSSSSTSSSTSSSACCENITIWLCRRCHFGYFVLDGALCASTVYIIVLGFADGANKLLNPSRKADSQEAERK
ncbi:hypothetical protein CBR_g40412 [Chara braunii]|uniref:Transmembrane protein n=1 Tax=Chara braunii TaxID=69332 RepID=A0A388LTN9_CHABU|nr:hypothetical protein CBR_g40412 [Chara braunii]|eukprot:GBG85680.1 hypothetical protein CBR_g40412 [Chara braunii]